MIKLLTKRIRITSLNIEAHGSKSFRSIDLFLPSRSSFQHAHLKLTCDVISSWRHRRPNCSCPCTEWGWSQNASFSFYSHILIFLTLLSKIHLCKNSIIFVILFQLCNTNISVLDTMLMIVILRVLITKKCFRNKNNKNNNNNTDKRFIQMKIYSHRHPVTQTS